MKPELLLDAATSSLDQGRAALRAIVAALGERVAVAQGPDAGLDACQGEALALARLHAQVFAAGALTAIGQYAEEFPVSRWFVDARVLSIFEGAEEVLGLKVIAPALLRGAGAG